MVDISAHSISYPAPARALRKSKRSFARGFVMAVPLSLALWAGIIWAVVQLF
ncbi:hypothetical protein ACFQI3_00005 [Hansschlegelia quercus]|uniref:hypothetical protein n=1 Tax=Hansschlegelia quercus TaxID=2528245 RepID=UPI0013EF2040|nr:hypothetical protein [Hansschlegelia quercus]